MTKTNIDARAAMAQVRAYVARDKPDGLDVIDRRLLLATIEHRQLGELLGAAKRARKAILAGRVSKAVGVLGKAIQQVEGDVSCPS